MTTPYLRRYYAGGGTSTNLSNAMGAFDGSFVINSDTGWPGSPGNSGGFIVVVDRGTSSEEKIRCSSNSGTTVTVASDGNGGRGYDGTSATSHNANAPVSLCGGAIDFDEANQVVTQVLGQSGAAKGDILFMESAAGPNTLARLGIGSTGENIGYGGSSTPAWEVIPGRLLATTILAPSTASDYSVAETTLAAVDTTNLTITCTVPASGNLDIDVEINTQLEIASTGSFLILALFTHNATTQVGDSITVLGAVEADISLNQVVRGRFHLTGLTPGSVQYDLAACYTTSSGASCTLFAQGKQGATTTPYYSPAVIQAFAA